MSKKLFFIIIAAIGLLAFLCYAVYYIKNERNVLNTSGALKPIKETATTSLTCENQFVYNYLAKAEISSDKPMPFIPSVKNWGFMAKITKTLLFDPPIKTDASSHEPSRTLFRYHFSNDVIQEELFALYQKNGHLEKLFIRNDTETNKNIQKATNYTKFALLALQLVRPNDSPYNGHNKWGTKEFDMSGNVETSYSQLDNLTIKKSRLKYIEIFQEAPATEIKDSDIDISVFENSNHNDVKSVTLHETIRVYPPLIEWMETKYQVFLTFLTMIPASSDDIRACHEASHNINERDVVQFYHLKELPLTYEIDDRKLGQENSKEVLSLSLVQQLNILKNNQADLKQKQDSFSKLVKYLTLHPEEIERIFNEIKSNQSSKEYIAYLIAILSHVSLQQSQDTLLRIMNEFSTTNQYIFEQAIQGHHNSPKPSVKNFTFLYNIFSTQEKDFAPDLRSRSILAAGTMVKNFKDPSDKETALNTLLKKLEESADSNQKALLIEAIGNSGDDRSYVYLKNYITSDTDVVNRPLALVAIEATRFMTSQEVEQDLRLLLLKKSDISFTKAIIYALSFRKTVSHETLDSVLSTYENLLTTNQGSDFRVHALNLLSSPLNRSNPAIMQFFSTIRNYQNLTNGERKRLAEVLKNSLNP